MTVNDSWRARLIRKTAPVAAVLATLPRWCWFVAVAALVLGGLVLGGVPGALLLIVVAGLAAWLALLGWDSLTWSGRVSRLLAILIVLAVATVRVLDSA
jgi:hypothetical protein